MRRLLNEILRRMGFQVTRATFLDQLIAQRDEAHELREMIARMHAGSAPDQVEPTDHLTSRIASLATSVVSHELAGLWESYSALRTADGRERVSRALMQAVTAHPQSAFVGDTGNMDAPQTHELGRQLHAAAVFALGRLDEAEAGLKALCNDIPTAFNFLCHARTLTAKGDERGPFFVLADGMDRFPTHVALTLEFATLFQRIEATEAANSLLDSIKHIFVDDRYALAPRQHEIDQAIDSGVTAPAGEHDSGSSTADMDTWQGLYQRLSTFTEFQDAHAALATAFQHEFAELLNGPASKTTAVIEFGTLCGRALAGMAAQFPHVHFIGVASSPRIKEFNDSSFHASNLTFTADDIMNVLARNNLGTRPLLFHGDAARHCYPAMLAGLYARCCELGMRHLLISEELDFDRIDLRFHEPGKFPRATRIGGNGGFLHDFKALLEGSGYRIAAKHPVVPVLIPDRSTFAADHRLLHAVLDDNV